MPGLIMPGDPQIGVGGPQEICPGQAEDHDVVLLTNTKVKVPAGSYSGAMITAERTPLEADVLSETAYAKGVGEVSESDVKGGDERFELISITKPWVGRGNAQRRDTRFALVHPRNGRRTVPPFDPPFPSGCSRSVAMHDSRPVDPRPNRRKRFKERARLEYLAGAEEDWRRKTGRPMTREELERALQRYPGDD